MNTLLASALLLSCTACLGNAQPVPITKPAAPAPALTIYPAPANAPLNTRYTVQVGGQRVPVYETPCRLQANVPAATCAFAYFDMNPTSAPVVEVTRTQTIQSALIRPLSKNIQPTISGRTLRFTLEHPSKLYVELNGDKTVPLLLFASEPFVMPDPGTPKLTVFAPGIHEIGQRILQSGETIVIQGGAIVRGTFYGENLQNVRIIGRGILDGSTTPDKQSLQLEVRNVSNFELSGIIIRDSPHWTVVLRGAVGATVKDVKIIGHRLNADGMDITNSRDVTVDDCFVYSADDSTSIKGTTYWGYDAAKDLPVDNVVVKNSFLITGLGGYSVRVGDETQAPYIQNVRYENIDVLNFVGGPIGVIAADSGLVKDLSFKNIRVEEYFGWIAAITTKPTEFATDGARGRVENVTIQDITVLKKFGQGASYVEGYSAQHDVKNVTLENIVIEGRRMTSVLEMPIYPIAPDLYPTKPDWWTSDYQTNDAFRSSVVVR
jgi:Glycosyl hydrolases family 28